MEKFFWIDLEMSGLDVNKEVILEVAAIITDLNFQILDTYHSVVKQSHYHLETMDEWNTKNHRDSGLTAAVQNGKEIHLVEDDLILFTKKHFKDRAVLAGNSIGQDRLFIDKYFPRFASLLHYRALDVTAWKIIMNHKFKKVFSKKNNHRALDDILESIAELQFYISFLKP